MAQWPNFDICRQVIYRQCLIELWRDGCFRLCLSAAWRPRTCAIRAGNRFVARVLRLPDLDHTKTAVLNSLSSPHSLMIDSSHVPFLTEHAAEWE